MEQYRALCDCIPIKSNFKTLKYLMRTEGSITLFNGLRQSLVAATLSNVTYMYIYERIRLQVKNYTQDAITIPLVTSVIARTITTTFIFPFDYWKTIQQGTHGQSKKSGFKMEMKPKAGYGALLQRDIMFSMIYWILTENTRTFLKYLRDSNEENTYNDNTTLVISNAIAGALSGKIYYFTNKYKIDLKRWSGSNINITIRCS